MTLQVPRPVSVLSRHYHSFVDQNGTGVGAFRLSLRSQYSQSYEYMSLEIKGNEHVAGLLETLTEQKNQNTIFCYGEMFLSFLADNMSFGKLICITMMY